MSSPNVSSVSDAARLFTRSTYLIVFGLILIAVGFNVRFAANVGTVPLSELVGILFLAVAVFNLTKIEVGPEFRDVMSILMVGLLFAFLLPILSAIRAARAPAGQAQTSTGDFLWIGGFVLFAVAMSWLCRTYGLKSTAKGWRILALFYAGYLFLIAALYVIFAVIIDPRPGGGQLDIANPDLGCFLLCWHLSIILGFLGTLNAMQRGLAKLSAS